MKRSLVFENGIIGQRSLESNWNGFLGKSRQEILESRARISHVQGKVRGYTEKFIKTFSNFID